MLVIEEYDFVHLHDHDGYSLFDGGGNPKQKAHRARKLGMKAIARTNHGTMAGQEDHYYECKQLGIKPILGCEIYYMEKFEAGKEFLHLRRHMTLLAMNFTGYSNLCKMMSEANRDNFYIKPIVTLEMLRKYNEGIICLSGCVLGEICYHIIHDDIDTAREKSREFISIFGDRFYFEVQPQEFDDQKKANLGVIQLASELNVEVVMTNDSHLVAEDDIDTYIVMRKMKKGDKKPEGEEDDMFALKQEQWEADIRKQYGNLYVASGYEMNKRWKALMGTDGEEYLNCAGKISDRVENYDLEFNEEVPEYIEYDDQGNKISAAQILAKRTREGMKERGLWKEPYISRAKYELELILKTGKGKADYYLLTADMVNFARSNGIPVGPGRGSGVASFVAYVLGIHDVNSVDYDLLFTRFINPERITMADFDIDFSARRDAEIAEYLKQKLNGRVAQICNILYYRGDNLVNDLAKVLKMDTDDAVAFKAVIGVMGYKEKDGKEPELSKLLFNKKLLELEQKYRICTHFVKMYNCPMAFGQHASGFAITPYDLSTVVPIIVRGKERKENTAYDMKSLARMKVVKVDVLKLDYVDIVYNCCKQIGMKPQDIPLDDPLVYQAYCDGNLTGIFQVDKHGGRATVKAVQPRNILDIMDIISLDRPGALSMGQTEVYLKGRKGIEDKTSRLYPFCKRTHGAFLYQEQAMEASMKLAGFSAGLASKVAKNLDALPEDHPLTIAFIEGAKKTSNIDRAEAIKLFKNITSYTFNMGHAIAYALLSYWGMWLKVRHPMIFFEENLKASVGKGNIKTIEADAIKNKLPIFIPSVNGEWNYHRFEAYPGDWTIRAGLASIKDVGGVAGMAIVEERKANGPYTSEEEFLARVNKPGQRKVITSRVYTALQGAGALEFDFEEIVRRTTESCSRIVATNGNAWRYRNAK